LNSIAEQTAEVGWANPLHSFAHLLAETFGNPKNKVKIQFPSEQGAYAWVNMSKYYPSAQVQRTALRAAADFERRGSF
jgi:uncharacterized protein (DUF1330 family)